MSCSLGLQDPQRLLVVWLESLSRSCALRALPLRNLILLAATPGQHDPRSKVEILQYFPRILHKDSNENQELMATECERYRQIISTSTYFNHLQPQSPLLTPNNNINNFSLHPVTPSAAPPKTHPGVPSTALISPTAVLFPATFRPSPHLPSQYPKAPEVTAEIKTEISMGQSPH